METLCEIRLRGIVGTASTTQVGDKKIVQFSLATEYAYWDRAGCAVIETTWFNCRAIGDYASLQRGSRVYLVGRVRSHRFIDGNGVDRIQYEVIVNTLEIL